MFTKLQSIWTCNFRDFKLQTKKTSLLYINLFFRSKNTKEKEIIAGLIEVQKIAKLRTIDIINSLEYCKLAAAPLASRNSVVEEVGKGRKIA